jgi:hypothetical protein
MRSLNIRSSTGAGTGEIGPVRMISTPPCDRVGYRRSEFPAKRRNPSDALLRS